MPEIGQRISFVPSAFTECKPTNAGRPVTVNIPHKITGVIDYINSAHRWFRARFEVHGKTMYEGFKF